jgi:hypothetical protein
MTPRSDPLTVSGVVGVAGGGLDTGGFVLAHPALTSAIAAAVRRSEFMTKPPPSIGTQWTCRRAETEGCA